MFIISVIGVYKFKYALNRMHAAAIVDSVGILLTSLSAIVAYGVSWASVKIIVIIIFIWLTSPVAAHLVSRIEVSTAPDTHTHMTVCDKTKCKEGENDRN